jgi:hypothetical protein
VQAFSQNTRNTISYLIEDEDDYKAPRRWPTLFEPIAADTRV